MCCAAPRCSAPPDLHHGLGFLPIAEASATSFVSPLFVTALSIAFLGERVGMRRWIATAVGLAGVFIILRPGTSAFHPAAVFPIVSALAWAGTLILTRMMSGSERPVTVMTYSSIVGVAIVSALVPFVWVTPSWHDIMFGILIGVASTVGQWIVVLAFRYGDASVLAPFSYTQLLWVSVLGFLIFGEVPDRWTILAPASSSPPASTPRIASASAARNCWMWPASRRRTPDNTYLFYNSCALSLRTRAERHGRARPEKTRPPRIAT